jgi:hypothetical protein
VKQRETQALLRSLHRFLLRRFTCPRGSQLPAQAFKEAIDERNAPPQLFAAELAKQ